MEQVLIITRERDNDKLYRRKENFIQLKLSDLAARETDSLSRLNGFVVTEIIGIRREIRAKGDSIQEDGCICCVISFPDKLNASNFVDSIFHESDPSFQLSIRSERDMRR